MHTDRNYTTEVDTMHFLRQGLGLVRAMSVLVAIEMEAVTEMEMGQDTVLLST